MTRREDATLARVREARKTLIRSGATFEQINALELALLQQVMSYSEIGGNASEYVLARIRTLGG